MVVSFLDIRPGDLVVGCRGCGPGPSAGDDAGRGCLFLGRPQGARSVGPARSGGPGRGPRTARRSSRPAAAAWWGFSQYPCGTPSFDFRSFAFRRAGPTDIAPCGLSGYLIHGRWGGQCAWRFIGKGISGLKDLAVPGRFGPPCADRNDLRGGVMHRARTCKDMGFAPRDCSCFGRCARRTRAKNNNRRRQATRQPARTSTSQ